MRLSILSCVLVLLILAVLNSALYLMLWLAEADDTTIVVLLTAVSVVLPLSIALVAASGKAMSDKTKKSNNLIGASPSRPLASTGGVSKAPSIARPVSTQQPVAMMGSQPRPTRIPAPNLNGSTRAKVDGYSKPASAGVFKINKESNEGVSSGKQAVSLSSLSAPDLLEEIHRHGHSIAILIRDTKERLRSLDEVTQKNIHLLDTKNITAVVNTRRILGALEHRLERLKELVTPQTSQSLVQARQLVESNLVIPADAVNALINTEKLPAIPSGQWESVVDRLLSAVERSVHELGYKVSNKGSR